MTNSHLKNQIPLKNENGSAIVMALLILLALTMIVLISSQSTEVELAMVRNTALYKSNFYRAESAAEEAAQILEAEPNPKTQLKPATTTNYANWLIAQGTDMTNVANWTAANSTGATNLPQNASRSAVYLGVAPGSSLVMGGTRLYDYAVYGLYDDAGGGRSMIQAGYRRRY